MVIPGSAGSPLWDAMMRVANMRPYPAPLRAVSLALLLATQMPAWSANGDEAAGGKLTLVSEGQPAATIILAASPADNARVAAGELQNYIEKITGARLPIKTDDDRTDGILILVGRSRLTDAMPDLDIPKGQTRRYQEEGFIIQTRGNRLILAGNDAVPYLGTRYAVIELLHRLGVRWFMPGEMGEVVPRMPTIAVGSMDIRQQPDFVMRNFWEHARGKMREECAEWKIHNKMNPHMEDCFGIPGDSSIRDLLPDGQFDAHPEWFALEQGGQRNRHHPCTTSEEMIRHFVRRIKDRAREGKRVTDFAPDDGNPRCWCDRCAKIANRFDGYGANERDPVPEASASNEWFYFINRILTDVNREFPDHCISTNGYANRDIPPEMPPGVDFNPNKNLTVMFANIMACTIHAYDDPKCWQMKRQGQMIRRWCELSDKVWIYNYNYTMLVNKATLTPMVHRIRRNIPLLKQWGVLGFHDQDEADWAMSGLTTRLVRARLEWDVRADVDAILDDFFNKWFGAAAEPMKAYYAALENAFDTSPLHGHEDVILPAIYTNALMATLDKHISAAESAVQSESDRSHLQLERLIYDNLRAYVALERAKRACDFPAAVAHVTRMAELQAQMNTITPFMGWHQYPVYGVDWEKKRMEDLAARTQGPDGRLVAILPEKAAFRVDPFDDGRFERWQDLTTDLSTWTTLATTAGWDMQGLHDKNGHPYKGVAWYRLEVDVPENVRGRQVRLHAPAVVNEVWLWVNGRYAGHRPYQMPWYRPQAVDLDVGNLLKPGAKNTLAIRVLGNFEIWGANGIYERMFLYTPMSDSQSLLRQDVKPDHPGAG